MTIFNRVDGPVDYRGGVEPRSNPCFCSELVVQDAMGGGQRSAPAEISLARVAHFIQSFRQRNECLTFTLHVLVFFFLWKVSGSRSTLEIQITTPFESRCVGQHDKAIRFAFLQGSYKRT